jgi:predicted nucleic acid-binding protein
LIILDASVVVSILLDPGPDAEPLRERVESPGDSVHVPHLLDVEVLNVLRRQHYTASSPRNDALQPCKT